MAHTHFPTDGKINASVENTHDSAQHKLGTRVTGSDGTEWMYVLDSGSGWSQYDFIGVDENFSAAALTKAMVDDGYYIGSAQISFAADKYGWIAMRGSNINGNLLASCAHDVALYSSGTAGKLDDDSSSQTKVDGVVAVGSTTAAGNVEIMVPVGMNSTTF